MTSAPATMASTAASSECMAGAVRLRRDRGDAAQLGPAGQLAGVDALDAVAQRALDVADVLDQAHEAADLDAGRLIGAPHRAVEGEVALDEAGALRDRGPGRRQPDLVARVADRPVVVAGAQRGDHVEVDRLDRA